MNEIENLFDEELLIPNLKGAAYFILLYEHFEDSVISTVEEFYSSPCMINGVMYSDIDADYISILKDKVKNGERNPFVPYERLQRRAEQARERYMQEIVRPKKEGDKEKDGKRFRGSLRWLNEKGALSESDVSRILKIRKRRNDIVHQLLQILSEGLTADDASMIADMLVLNRKINVWRFCEVEIPVSEVELPEGATPEDVSGGDDVILSGLFRILFLNEGTQFKEAIEGLIG